VSADGARSPEEPRDPHAPPPASAQAALRGLAVRAPAERYRVEREIGRGGMGAVFEVWDAELRRTVAMKVAHGELVAGSPEVATRFVEEARVTGRIDHPGIIPVHELGLDGEGQPYFTMKLVSGGRTLEEAFALARERRDGWTRERALDAILRMCEAVAFAHSRGVLHRDLKPDNVMVGRFGETYVMDWGIAKVRGREEAGSGRSSADSRDGKEEGDGALTREGAVLGTPAYMAPEQALGGELSPRSDVYSAGAILYQFLTGRRPHVHALEGPPVPVTRLAPDAPPELVAIAEKAMAREPTRRYADMIAMAADLRAFLEGKVVRAYRTGALVELRKWIARNRGTAATAAGAVLAVLLVTGGSAALFAEKNDELEGLVADLRRTQGELEERTAEAQRERTSVLRLSALQDVEGLVAEARGLWPPLPEQRAALEDWIRRARGLLNQRPVFLARRDALRARALPRSEAEVEAAARDHPLHADLLRERARREALRRAVAVRDGRRTVREDPLPGIDPPSDAYILRNMAWQLVGPERETFGLEERGLAYAQLGVERASGPDDGPLCQRVLANALLAVGLVDEALDVMCDAASAPSVDAAEGREALAELEQRAASLDTDLRASERRVAELEELVAQRSAWSFASTEDAWLHAQLSELVVRLSALRGLLEEDSREYGWGVQRRLAEAESLAALRDGDPLWRARWDEAVAAVARSSHYGGMELSPQVDLLPLGADPVSGLEEFACLFGGEPPQRGPDGRLACSEGTSPVLVLLPGGEFSMGTQEHDPAAPNYDPLGLPEERPPHLVRVAPLLLSKFELTQSQWLALASHNPSASPVGAGTLTGRVDGRHPVTNVSWFAAEELLRRFGLRLPTEAEWEYAARAGTTTAWSTGADAASLAGHANLGDAIVIETYGTVQGWTLEAGHRDGYVIHAPVGSFLPNAFGLHDVHGNVAEWCADAHALHFYVESPRDEPFNVPSGDEPRVVRGGAYNGDASFCRSGARISGDPHGGGSAQGLRPARSPRTR